MTTWNNDLELQFLEHYQGEPVLWDAKHRYHKDKNKNNDAWFRISSSMGIDVTGLKKKRDSLLSSFRKYRKIVKDSVHSGAGAGEIYKPVWFAFKLMNSFLGEGLTCKSTINTISNVTILLDMSESETMNIYIAILFLQIEEHSQGEGKIQENDENILATLHLASTSSKTEPPTKRRRKNPYELQEAGSLLKQAVSSLDVALKQTVSHEDECDLYGKILAVKLRKMPERKRLQFMHEVDGMFLRYELFPSRTPTYSYVASPAPSPGSTYESINRPNSMADYHSDDSTRASFQPDINTENDGPLIIIHSNDIISPPN
ncbi:hypothetical protein ABEB36_010728 [Hypothenemus hampei]|uniref:MADF domain-containing protein n=1 Tax=Hypothenemus hampei TaxID=57062 RepID=A0ABD1ED70_HYPHA